MKKILTTMAVAALVFSACSKDEGSVAGDNSIRIIPTIANPPVLPPVAKSASTRASDTDFQTGDQVGLMVTMTADGTKYAQNQLMTYDGSEFTTEGFVWYEDANTTSSLYAYYPYVTGGNVPTEFTVKADQSDDGYTASDLIVAVKTGVKPTKSPTSMTFKHKNTRIIIAVKNESGFDITSVAIKGTVATGEIDTETGAFAAKSGVEPSDVVAFTATANKLYYALLVPQNGVQIKAAVTTADGKTRTMTVGTTDLKSGENRRMDMNVQEADLQVKFSGPITDWIDGDDLLPEGPGEVDVPTVEWGGVKYEIITLKDGRTWMKENLRYVPAGKSISSDPTDGNGIWYPCDLTKTPSAELVEEAGLLYSYPVLLGIAGGFTSENYDKYERVQGICPDGWHIPTVAEWLKLAGVGSGSLTDPTSPYFEQAQNGASIVALNADGFNIAGAGYINAANSTATPAYMATASAADASAFGLGYYAGSSAYQITYNTANNPASGIKNVQYYAAMITYNKTYNRLTVAYQNAYSAAPVRCIKDKE